MPRRTEKRVGTQGPGMVEQLLLPLVRGAVLTKALLREFVTDKGLEAVRTVFAEEAAALAGVKKRHRADRTAHHWGYASAELTLGGRRVVLPRPRVRSIDGRELSLPSVTRFSGRDPLTERVLERVLLGVSTRNYRRSLEPVGAPVATRATSKSAVSRTFVRATRERVEAELGRSLESLLSAYRYGARVTLRAISRTVDVSELAPDVILALGESLFAYIDELSAASAQGYALEQSERAGEHQRRP